MTYPSVLFSVPDYVPPVLGTDSYTIPEANSRYFLTFPGVNQYVSIPEVTLSGAFSISMMIYPTSVRAHLLADNTGGSRLFYEEVNNKIELLMPGQVVSFSGLPPKNQLSLLTLSRDASNNYTCVLNGVSLNITAGQGGGGSFAFNSIGDQFGGATSVPNFEGVVSNLLIIDNGTPVRFYPLDDNATTIRDTIGGNDGTYINGAPGDWELFVLGSDNIWVGPAQPVAANSGVLGDDSDPEFFIAGSVRDGSRYRVSATVDTFSGSGNCGWSIGSSDSNANGIPEVSPFRETAPAVNTIVGGDFTSTNDSDVRLFGRVNAIVSYRDISVRRILSNA